MPRVLAISGGVGGAKLALGMSRLLEPHELTIAVNTGDDETFHGLHVSPDVDTVVYALAGLTNPETGWGVAGDTFRALDALGRLGGETWFRLGDLDLAMHLRRTELLAAGSTLTEATRAICDALGVRHPVVPMSDAAVRTIARTEHGEMAFQEYFVRHACEPRITGVRFAGAENAPPSPALSEAIANADAIVFCPSNPLVSIEPVLAVQGVRDAIERFTGPRIAVSPIVGGTRAQGPRRQDDGGTRRGGQQRRRRAPLPRAPGRARHRRGRRRRGPGGRGAGHRRARRPHHHDHGRRQDGTRPRSAGARGADKTATERAVTGLLPHPLRTIVPMKPLAEAKTRLWDDLPSLERQAVVLLMLERVVTAALNATARGACVVVGGDEVVREVAEASGARWVPDHATGLNAALWAAIQTAYTDGAEATLFLPGDLPLVTYDDVLTLVAASDQYTRTVCVRASSDGGTNALLQPAGTAFEPLLGQRSFREALSSSNRSGSGAGQRPILPRVAFDLDTRADYEWAKGNVAWFARSVYDWGTWLGSGRKGALPSATH